MEIAATNPPVWKYQRQFDFAEGVSTLEQRPNLLRDTAPRLLTDEQVRSFLANGQAASSSMPRLGSANLALAATKMSRRLNALRVASSTANT